MNNLKASYLAIVGVFLFSVIIGLLAIHTKYPEFNEYTVRIMDKIEEKTVKPAIDVLIKAEKGDIVHIYMNSPGGFVDAGQDLLMFMRNTKARVVYHVPYLAMSAAAVPLCYTDINNLDVAPSAMIMFHGSQLTFDDGVQIAAKKMLQPNPFVRLVIASDDIVFKPCLELMSVGQRMAFEAGEEVWLTGKEFMDMKREALKDNFTNELNQDVRDRELARE